MLRALTIAERIQRGMVHVHANNIVHRDLKPANILLTAEEDNPKLADFGLACLHAEAPSAVIAGTFAYMPREAFSDRTHAPQQSDLWATGMILFEMLTGRRPNMDPNSPWKAPPPLPPEVPPLVRAIVERALSEKPEDRYQTAAEMLEAVSSALRRTRPLSGPSAAIVVKAAKQEWPRRVKAALGAAVVALLAAAMYFVLVAERVPITTTDFSVPTRLHLEAMDLGHRIRNQIVTEVNPRVGNCQARALGRGVGGRGTLAMSFTVRGNGSVANVNVGGTAPMDEVMRRCMVRAAGQREFSNWAHEEAVAMMDYELMTPAASPHRAQGP